MKYLTYFVTFTAHSSILMMRMALPIVQSKLLDFFKIDKMQMGLANALIYILLGISYLWRALVPITDRQFTYLWSMSLSNLGFLITPILIALNAPIIPLYYLGLALFGFFQTAAWPVCLSLVHAYFLPKKDGCTLGFWSGNGDVGTIFGNLLCIFILYNLNLPYQYCLFVTAFISIIMSLSVYQLRIEPSQINQKQIKQQQIPDNTIQLYKKALKQPQIIFLLVMLSVLKGLLYGILLWLPMYFEKSGFKQYQGYIPIIMNCTAIFGSIVLGAIYQKTSNKLLRASFLMSTLIITCASFFVIRQVQFTFENRLILQILIGIIGFCVMGNYNILATLQITGICDRLGLQITALSSLSSGFASLIVGIIQIIIGRFATDNTDSIFMIFFIIGIFMIVLQALRIIYINFFAKQKNQDDDNNNEEKQNTEPLIIQNSKNQNEEIL